MTKLKTWMMKERRPYYNFEMVFDLTYMLIMSTLVVLK